MKKKKIKWGRIISLLIVLTILVGSGIGFYFYKDKIMNMVKKFSGKTTEVVKKNNIKSVEEPKIEEYGFSMVAVGDALIHAAVYQDAYVGSNKYDFTKMFTHIKPMIADYDLKFYNQETVIGGKHIGLSHYPTFNSPDEIGLDMLKTGFNIVNLATNHTMDRGEAAAKYQLDFWKKQDAYVAGSYSSKAERDNIKVAEINGITYAMLGYSYGTNGLPVPIGKEYLINVWPYDSDAAYNSYKTQVKKDIEAIRNKVDVLIVSMHWGVEYTHEPTQHQKDQAKYLASLGVDVIIGHHPHVIQPITYIDDTLVIYSLGNFISGQIGEEKLVGLIAGFDVTKTVEDGKSTIKVINPRAELLWTHYSPSYTGFQVIPFSKLSTSIKPDRDAALGRYKPIITRMNKNIKYGI